ncbi:DnaJ family domain-containing protein [Paenibacillus alvei]|uniref:DnaJ family domain-containing protein n=1 Tax=Paenibacillus alvei TaxID=44250 RepID=UPI00227EB49C|nr:DnaJ family domain-containing protein [Paenibacillus alvei]
MDIIGWMAEQKIQEAMNEGGFDELPGKGKPLVLKDLSHVPEELRPAYLMMQNAGLLPEELHVGREVVRLEQLLAACTPEDEQKIGDTRRQLNERRLRLQMMMEERGWAVVPAFAQYESQIVNKVSRVTEPQRED